MRRYNVPYYQKKFIMTLHVSRRRFRNFTYPMWAILDIIVYKISLFHDYVNVCLVDTSPIKGGQATSITLTK